VIKVMRYLGHINPLEVHDTQNEKSLCQLDGIKVSTTAGTTPSP
jgi:hypothetical protein